MAADIIVRENSTQYPVASFIWVSDSCDPRFATCHLQAFFIAAPDRWTFAAFGEEISYRGYLINRAADAAGRSKAAYWVAMVLVAVLFGYGHFYKGPAGILDSGRAGLVLGAAYLLSGRNLWACILGHGFIDTVGVVAVFFGWAT